MGAIAPRSSVAIGAFPSVPDISEWQTLEQRVASLEATLKAQTTEHASFKATFQSSLTQITEMLQRLGSLEVKFSTMESQMAELLRNKQFGESAELRRQTKIEILEQLLKDVDERLRQHVNNRAIHVQPESGRFEPKGFQQNDQPRQFMGSGRM